MFVNFQSKKDYLKLFLAAIKLVFPSLTQKCLYVTCVLLYYVFLIYVTSQLYLCERESDGLIDAGLEVLVCSH